MKVISVTPQCRPEDCPIPDATLKYQSNALDQLLFLEWEEGQDFSKYHQRQFFINSPYLFDDSAGQDIRVYIVDTGANLGNKVSYLYRLLDVN